MAGDYPTDRTDNEIEDDITRIKEWLVKQPHLPHDIGDNWLRQFVTGTKSLEIAKQKLNSWLSIRGYVPELRSPSLRNVKDPKFQESCKAMKAYILPKRTPEGYHVFVIEIGLDLNAFNHSWIFTRVTMMIDYLLGIEKHVKGFFLVADFDGANSSLLTKFSLTLTKSFFQYLQSAIPLKTKGFVFINSSTIVEVLTNTLFKPFLSEKMVKRLNLTSEGREFLKTLFPVEILPEDFGGTAAHSDVMNADWLKILEEKTEWFNKMDYLVSDENKRPTDKKHFEDIQGTFRSLAID